MGLPVGEVAGIAGVTVRTLHHYDEVGLLTPSGRTPAGYRQYDEDDLERLQRILCYRALGFPLEAIAGILDDPSVDPVEHLRQQQAQLLGEVERLQRLVASVARMIDARRLGITLTPEELFDVFGDFDPTAYADEVEERWGGTDAHAQSMARTSTYTKEDWARCTAEGEAVTRRLADLLDAGVAPDDARATAAAEEHRRHITRWFYDCSPEVHRGLGAMYVTDPRFTATYEAVAPGLAVYVRDAIAANADARAVAARSS